MKLVSKIVPLLTAGILVGGLAWADTNDNSNTNTNSSSTRVVNVACMQAAVGKREDAISSAVTTYNMAVVSGLSTRKSALMAAWAIVDRKTRRKALISAHRTFQTSERLARKTKRDARNAAWAQYRSDRNACGPQHATQDVSGESGDSQL